MPIETIALLPVRSERRAHHGAASDQTRAEKEKVIADRRIGQPELAADRRQYRLQRGVAGGDREHHREQQPERAASIGPGSAAGRFGARSRGKSS